MSLNVFKLNCLLLIASSFISTFCSKQEVCINENNSEETLVATRSDIINPIIENDNHSISLLEVENHLNNKFEKKHRSYTGFPGSGSRKVWFFSVAVTLNRKPGRRQVPIASDDSGDKSQHVTEITLARGLDLVRIKLRMLCLVVESRNLVEGTVYFFKNKKKIQVSFFFFTLTWGN